MAIMTMPEAAIHKDGRAVLWEDQIWLTGQPGIMEAIAKPPSEQLSSYK
jgi:hypothetical protein